MSDDSPYNFEAVLLLVFHPDVGPAKGNVNLIVAEKHNRRSHGMGRAICLLGPFRGRLNSYG